CCARAGISSSRPSGPLRPTVIGLVVGATPRLFDDWLDAALFLLASTSCPCCSSWSETSYSLSLESLEISIVAAEDVGPRPNSTSWLVVDTVVLVSSIENLVGFLALG